MYIFIIPGEWAVTEMSNLRLIGWWEVLCTMEGCGYSKFRVIEKR